MMSGGGFVGQMHSTFKQNRDLLKSTKRKAYEWPLYSKEEKAMISTVYPQQITADDKLYWKKKIAVERRQQNMTIVVVLLTSVVTTFVLFFYLYAEFARGFLQLWD
jgi:hypothetical protein